LIKLLSISGVYPEDVGFRVFVVKSVSVFNGDLRFSAVRCQHGREIVGEETVPDASQSTYRNTKCFLKSLFDLSHDVFAADEFLVPLKWH
jgi:hypothetical protein